MQEQEQEQEPQQQRQQQQQQQGATGSNLLQIERVRLLCVLDAIATCLHARMCVFTRLALEVAQTRRALPSGRPLGNAPVAWNAAITGHARMGTDTRARSPQQHARFHASTFAAGHKHS